MKTYMKLNIIGHTEILVSILSQWKQADCANWQYDQTSSKDYASNIFLKRNQVACFTYIVQERATAKLWITISKACLTITNITPLLTTKLEMDEYNNILQDFYQKHVIALHINDIEDVKINIQGPELTLEDMANKETADALIRWEGACNRDNGNLHPYDEERWFHFVITAAKTNSPLMPGDLKKWLIEDRGWFDEDTVDRLQSEYENERRLLEYTKKRKRL